jgi:NAD+ synthase
MRQIAQKIVAWLREHTARAGSLGYVVGLSGGIDSATTAALCQRAVGEHVLGVLMPCHSQPEDAQMARLAADAFGLETVTVDLGAAYDAMLTSLPGGLQAMAKANIKPRLRMAALYALAQTRSYLVAGTGNASELMVGYFTKYGDGGVDVEPLGNLYKWQVRSLAAELAVPQSILDRSPSAGLWSGQTDEEELGITYEDLDATLAAITLGHASGVEPALLTKVQQMVAASAHKRAMPPVCPI